MSARGNALLQLLMPVEDDLCSRDLGILHGDVQQEPLAVAADHPASLRADSDAVELPLKQPDGLADFQRCTAARIATACNVSLCPRKKSSLPSPRHSGHSPPAVEI
jgi:hypothetical protein